MIFAGMSAKPDALHRSVNLRDSYDTVLCGIACRAANVAFCHMQNFNARSDSRLRGGTLKAEAISLPASITGQMRKSSRVIHTFRARSNKCTGTIRPILNSQKPLMKILGIETSCDETGVAIYDTDAGLLGHCLHSQIELHAEYGGVVPELASRDHIRRLPLLIRQVLTQTGLTAGDVDGVAYTSGPGLAGALLVGASVAASFGMAAGVPVLPVHHLEGHLLSPLLSADPPAFPFVALLVSGGHTQLMRVTGVGDYELLGESLDDAAGEAFDKTAKLLGLGYPGGPQLAKLAERGTPGHFKLPRPMLNSGDLDFSFSGLKTAVLNIVSAPGWNPDNAADLAADFQLAVTDVLCAKALTALKRTGLKTLVVAGGVGANVALRARLNDACAQRGARVFYPEPELCTDNGAMIAFAGALRLAAGERPAEAAIQVRPRWPLTELDIPRAG